MSDVLQSAVVSVLLFLILSCVVAGAFWFWDLIKGKTGFVVRDQRPVPDVHTAWTERDRDQLIAFLASTTGRRLLARLSAMEANIAVRACQATENTADAAARAGGYGEMLKHFMSLTHAAERVEERPEDAEKLSPDAELIARLSP
jgi:hypothetical protein